MADGSGGRAVAPYSPTWLQTDDVKRWLRLNAVDSTDDDLVTAAAAMAEPYVERCRPEWAGIDATDPDNPVHVYLPDAETYQGAVMYAAREYRRRNSPAGIETFGDATSFVSRFDPDIERALQTGSYARPVVG
jgi:hypothetical protein